MKETIVLFQIPFPDFLKMNLKMKTLFICFYFPPFNRVGGRRWAKHIKYFQKFGEDFHVLAGDYLTTSPWDEDLVSYKSKITRISVSVFYPYFKKVLPTNFLQKTKWLLSLWYNKILEKTYKGIFWDDSRTYEILFFEQAKKIIKTESINHVCLSVGPYSYATILPLLKKEFPNLKITLDLRDYWEDCFLNLSSKNIAAEEKKIASIMKKIDLVLAPNTEICNYYKEKYYKETYCLPHCIDEEFLNIQTANIPKKEANEFIIVYGGNLYNQLEIYIHQLINIIKNIEDKGYNVKLKIYTMQPNYVDLFKQNNISCTISQNLPTKEFIDVVINSDLLVLFRPAWSPNGFSTKFFEYVAFRKPMLYLGPVGEVNKYILDNNLGYTLDEKETFVLTNDLLDNIKTKKIPDINFDLSTHTVEFQTKNLIQFWNSYYAFTS